MGLTRLSLSLVLGTTLLANGAEPEPDKRKKTTAVPSASVTVTAEAHPVELAKTPNPVKVVDKQALERLAPVTVIDLLKSLMPGQIMTSGGVGTAASFFMGGSRSQDTVVMLNGVKLQDQMSISGLDLNVVNMAGIDRVEVQQGPCSARYGSSAMGGVVALSTAGACQEGLSGQVTGGLGTMGIRRGSASTAFGWNGGWVRLATGASQEFQVIDTNNPYRTAGTSLGFGQTFGEDTLLSAQYLNTYSATPTPFGYDGGYKSSPRPAGAFAPQRENRRRFEVLSTSLRTVLSKEWMAELHVGGFEMGRMEANYTNGLPTDPWGSRGSQANLTLSWTPEARYGFSQTTSFSRESGFSPAGTKRNSGHGNHLALAVEGWVEATSSLRVTGAFRQQMDSLTLQAATASQPAERPLSASTAKLGLNWNPTPGLRFYVSGGTAYAHPMINQLLYNLQNAGPELENERSKAFQMGMSWEQNGWNARLDLIRNRFASMVYYDPTLGLEIDSYGYKYKTGAYASGQNIRLQSAECALGYRTATWTLEGFLRNQEARDLGAPESKQLSSSAVLRRPFFTCGLNGSVVFGALRLDGRWSRFGSRYEYGLPFPYRSHFNDLSVGAHYDVSRTFSVALKGDHLMQSSLTREDWLSRRVDFENDRAMIFGFPAQSRTVTLEGRYRF